MKKGGHNVFKLLMLVISILILFNSSIVFSGDSIPIDLNSSNLSVISSDTIRIDNLKIPEIEGTYWATFRWNPYTYKFDVIDAGVSNAKIYGTWTGTWYSAYSGSGDISATFSQVDSNLTANMTFSDTALGTITFSLSVSVNGDILDMSDTWYNGHLYLKGTLSGNTIIGNYDCFFECGDCDCYDSGTFIIER